MADVTYVLKEGQQLTDIQIAQIEEARKAPIEFDEDCPEIDPVETPELYEAMMQAVVERNQRVAARLRGLA